MLYKFDILMINMQNIGNAEAIYKILFRKIN